MLSVSNKPNAAKTNTPTQAAEKPFQWDNWIVDLWDGNRPVISRFSLEAPRNADPESRHNNARIGLYLPTQSGEYRRFCAVTDKMPTWSGSALNLSVAGREADLDNVEWSSKVDARNEAGFEKKTLRAFKDSALVVAYTSRVEGKDALLAPQAISLCYKPKGQYAFLHHENALNPFTLSDPTLKYYKTDESEHVISAWRDPYIFFENDRFHMLFAARYSQAFYNQLPSTLRIKHRKDAMHAQSRKLGYDSEVNSTVGYATSRDLKTWKLHKPLFLPGNATQFELPTLTRVEDGYVLSVAVANGWVDTRAPDDCTQLFGPRHQYPLMFKMTAGLDHLGDTHAWEALDWEINEMTHPLAKTYGLTFHTIQDAVYATAFNENNFTMTPLVKLSNHDFPANLPSEDDLRWSA